jgi:transposase
VAGAGEARRADLARRPGVATALDVQEHARLSAELFAQHDIRLSHKPVAKLLRDHGYSLQAPNKSVEGAQHPDRNAQFEHINAKAQD